ncbi:hypothetical protein QE381_000410 [Microbacterium sp. SORGH_AS 888]|nr:hypothetical protein [Microbacterium sp. SORGH_AS_0888]
MTIAEAEDHLDQATDLRAAFVAAADLIDTTLEDQR